MVERRRGRLWWKILLALVLVVVTALVAVYWYMRPLLLTGTGYAAHNACAVTHVSDRTDPENDLPPNPLVPYLRTTSDDGSVTATILGLFAGQSAAWTEGFGCTRADERPDLPEPLPVTHAHPLVAAPAPAAAPSGIDAAIDAAFGEDYGTRAVVVVKDGELVAERYADGFTAETPQLGWSMSKSVTNLLIGRLVAEHGFDIHATDLRPEWAGDERSQITPDNLMRMTSGLAWDETYDLGTPITEMLYIADDMGAFVASQELEFPVGEVLEYSTGSTNLLCSVALDAVDGDANLPRELLLAPLGLTHAVWEPDAAGVPACGSYLWATPREFAALGQFAMDDGVVAGEALLPEGWMEEATTPTGHFPGVDPYGASWWLNEGADGGLRFPDLPADAYWMSGHDGQWVFVVPSEDTVVVRMGFSPNRGIESLGVPDLVAGVLDVLGE
ncbi:serine hydrolase [Tessaracoccus terricola]